MKLISLLRCDRRKHHVGALAFVVATSLVAPPGFAQEDDMPDGDADIVEKPKKKEEPKKPPPKKEEPKKAPPPAKKEEKKKDEPKKDEPKKEAPPKTSDDDDLPSGDDDILSAPKKDPPPAKKETPPSKEELNKSLFVGGSDDDDDDAPARPRETSKPERAPASSTPIDDEDLPSRTDRSVNPSGGGGGGGGGDTTVRVPAREDTARASHIDDELPLVPIVDDDPPAKRGGDNSDRVKTVIDAPVAAPEETEGPPTGLIVGGAVGGALVVLAGAGVGGYFLVQALASGSTGTVVITAR